MQNCKLRYYGVSYAALQYIRHAPASNNYLIQSKRWQHWTNGCIVMLIVNWRRRKRTCIQKRCWACIFLRAVSSAFSSCGRIIGWEVSISNARSPRNTLHHTTRPRTVTLITVRTVETDCNVFSSFFTRDSSTGRYTAERVLATVILSVCLSATTRYRFKPMWDRDSGFHHVTA